jgi:hypothetical protein
MRRGVSEAALIAMMVVVCAAAALGQSGNATLSASVGDASGVLIPGVAITAENKRTGITSSTSTFNQLTNNTPTVVGVMPENIGRVYEGIGRGCLLPGSAISRRCDRCVEPSAVW